MNPIPVPSEAKQLRPLCELVRMGPPPGVSEEDCGTVEMLISNERIAGVGGRGQYAYFRPNPVELQTLVDGGYIEIAQYGTVVQPFSATVWGPIDLLMQQARDLVASERQRQQDVEGYSLEHDRQHPTFEFLQAAQSYERAFGDEDSNRAAASQWPWSLEYFKPRDRKSNLIRSAALLQAEIDLERFVSGEHGNALTRARDRVTLLIAGELAREARTAAGQ